jgi:hypothetical protein
MAEYILRIAKRHNSLLVFFVEGGLGGAEIAISQPGLGICFPTGRKHVAMINEMI